MDNKRTLGSRYEEVAAAFLKTRGYEILQRNYRCPLGEMDIIAREDDYLVFLEVKYRKNAKMGNPAEAVHFYKQRKLSQVARYYLMVNGFSEEFRIRFDVVAILGAEVTLYQNAF